MFRRFRVTSPIPNLLLSNPTSLSALNRPRFLPSFSRYFSSSSPAMSVSPVKPMKEVLLVGYVRTNHALSPIDIVSTSFGNRYGAVGAIYAYILQKSGRARVTAVARSNFDVISSAYIHSCSPDTYKRPRCSLECRTRHEYSQFAIWRHRRLASRQRCMHSTTMSTQKQEILT